MLPRALRPLVRDLAAGLLYRSGLTRPGRAGQGRLSVATFHRVLPAEALKEYELAQIAVTVEEFGWFLDFFARHYTCGSLASVHRRWLGGERPERPFLAITLDDGQRDGFEHALPLLDRSGLKASFFVPVDAVDGNEPLWHDRVASATGALLARDPRGAGTFLAGLGIPGAAGEGFRAAAAVAWAKQLPVERRLEAMARIESELGRPARPAWDGLMSWDQLRDLVRRGHEVGSHSLSHPILPLVADDQLEREVGGSKARIEAELGVPCESFCYPNGGHDARVVESVRRAGYLRAVTTAWGSNGRDTDALALRRCDIQGERARDRAGQLSEPRQAYRLSSFFPGPR